MGERFSWDKLLRRGKQDEDNTINITPNEEPMAPVAPLKSKNNVSQSVPLAKASPDVMAPPPMAQDPAAPAAPKAPLVIEWNQYQQLADSNAPASEAISAPAPEMSAPPAAPASMPPATAPAPAPAAEVSEVANAFWNKMGSETAEALHSAPTSQPRAASLGWDDVELTPAERASGRTGEVPPTAQIPVASQPIAPEPTVPQPIVPESIAPIAQSSSFAPPAIQVDPTPMQPISSPLIAESEAPAGIVEADIFQPIQVELLSAPAPEWSAPATSPTPPAAEPTPVAPVVEEAVIPPAIPVETPPALEPLSLTPSASGLQPLEVGEPRRSGGFGSSYDPEERPRLMGFGEGTKVLGASSEPVSQEVTPVAEVAPEIAAETPAPMANPWASLSAPTEATSPAPIETPAASAWNLPPVTPPVADEVAPAGVTEAPACNLPPVESAAPETASELPPIAEPVQESTSAWGQVDTTPEPEPAAPIAPFSWSQMSEASPAMPAPITVEEPLVAELPPIAEPTVPAWGSPASQDELPPVSESLAMPPVFESVEVSEVVPETSEPSPVFEAPVAQPPVVPVPAAEQASEAPSIFSTTPPPTAAPREVPSIFSTPPAAETTTAPPVTEPIAADPHAIPAAYAKRPADDLSVQKARDNRLGDLLVGNKLITQKQLERALERQKDTNERLGQILIAMQTMSEKRLLQVLAAQKGVSPWHLETDTPAQDAVTLLPEEMCRIFQVIPVAIRGDLLLLAMRDTEDLEAIEAVRNHTKRRIEPVLADEARLAYTIDKAFGIAETRRLAAMDELVGEAMDGVDHSRPLGTQERAVLSEEDTRPVVGLVNQIIEDGIRMRASDIHIEPGYEKIEIRYRLDGRLTTVRELPIELLPMLVTRVKILSELDIVEYRMPQDGRITAQFGPHVVDLRVSVLPNYHGPRVVLRILDKSVGLKKLTDLGFEDRNLTLFKDLVAKPYGLFLVTGPTGSGKTTTLYSALNELRDTATNIMTCEDPVEYDLAGINQSQVNEKVGLTFAHQLRAILRQDPDVVLVGEIRDKETAETAIRAAMTGHMVLSTLHCNDAPGAIPRLLDMGVDPYLLSTALVGTMSQRLVRVLCQKCKVEDDATPEETETMAKLFGVPDVKKIWRATGCDDCYNTGYKGRVAVHEILPVAEEIAHLIAERAPMETLRSRASYYGYLPMQQDAAARVLRGETTLEEAKRLISFDTFEKLETPRSLEWKSAS